jgi:hypothetical protein
VTAGEPPVEVKVRQGVMRPGWYWWAAMLASSLAVGVAAVLIGIHGQQESERKWCSIVTTLDSAYRQQPPQTPTGKQVASDMAQLRRSLRCR